MKNSETDGNNEENLKDELVAESRQEEEWQRKTEEKLSDERKRLAAQMYNEMEEERKRREQSDIDIISDDGFEMALRGFVNYLDFARRFIKIQPLFYTKEHLWFMWNHIKKMWQMVDETDIMNKVDKGLESYEKTTNQSKKAEIIEALKRIGRQNVPKELKKTWVQFNNKIIDVATGEIFESTSEYFATNPIPWDIGESESTPTMDKVFAEWVGEENVQKLHDIIAYCALADYPVHLLFALIGGGRNGKDSFMKVIRKFVGHDNVSTIRLKHLQDRFELSNLYKKLITTSSEMNVGLMKDTESLKELSGESSVVIEFKGKTPFPYVNYAKLLLAMNDLPITLDMTDGYFSRWMLINFLKQFDGTVDIVATIPDIEFNNLARKTVNILGRIVKTRQIVGQGSLQERKEKYQKESDVLQLFIENFCEKDPNSQIGFSEFYDQFKLFLGKQGKRIWTSKETTTVLRNKGFEKSKKTINGVSIYWILGLKFSGLLAELVEVEELKKEKKTQKTQKTITLLHSTHIERSKDNVISDISVISDFILDKISKAEDHEINIKAMFAYTDAAKFERPLVERVIEKMKTEGLLLEPTPGMLKKV